MRKALEGIRVLDFTQFLAGPYCGMMLADMGAEVIKIENPKIGDFTRTVRPQVNGQSMYFNNVNRNKKSMTIDLKSKEGKEIFAKMIETADVLLENNRPGVMDRLGFGYEQINQLNERIIFASISGFGQYGPYRERPGYDIIAQAMGGAMSVTGWENGPSTRAGVALGDILGGLNAALGIMAALRYRELSGKGQQIDVSLVDSIVSSLETISTQYIYEGKIPSKTGNRYMAAYPYDSFDAMDGEYVIACGTDVHFVNLANAMGKRELTEMEEYRDIPNRKENWKALKAIINDWGKDKKVEEIVDLITEAGVPVSAILNMKQVIENEHIAVAREMFVDIENPVAGKIKVTGNPIKMSATPTSIDKSAPLLGENNVELLSELGINLEMIDILKEKKII
ncbi:MAG: CoA transferase [Tissierellales bacterium]|nr:CoA transferase [Tissierellales bacterium]MBN2828414.1 CoA transferase [Tissierellales bacterium]